MIVNSITANCFVDWIEYILDYSKAIHKNLSPIVTEIQYHLVHWTIEIKSPVLQIRIQFYLCSITKSKFLCIERLDFFYKITLFLSLFFLINTLFLFFRNFLRRIALYWNWWFWFLRRFFSIFCSCKNSTHLFLR